MWYGFTRQRFVQSLGIFTLIGLVAALLGLIGSKVGGSDIRNYWALAWIVFGIPTIWIVLASIFSVTWLKVEHSDLEWYLWKRFLIIKCPIQSVLTISPGLFSAVNIRTSRGTIHLFGLHLEDKADLTQHLIKINPNIKLASN